MLRPSLACLLLAGCAAAPPIVQTRTVTVSVPVYVALPAALTAPVPIPEPVPNLTYEDVYQLAYDRGNALKQANGQLKAIRDLQPKDSK